MRIATLAFFLATGTALAQPADLPSIRDEPAAGIEGEGPSCRRVPPTDPAQCYADPCTVTISASAGPGPETAFDPRRTLVHAAGQPNTLIRLSKDIELNFERFPCPDGVCIVVDRCVTIESATAPSAPGASLAPSPSAGGKPAKPKTGAAARRAGETGFGGGAEKPAAERAPKLVSARSPRSLGPLLRFGPSRDDAQTFIIIRTYFRDDGEPHSPRDHVKIRGFRLFGPSFGQQSTGEAGIRIISSADIEISNMEIAGWGGAAISIEDDPTRLLIPEGCERKRRPRSRLSHLRPTVWTCPEGKSVTPAGPRITAPEQIRIQGNYIHHNQQPSEDGHAGGYGVDVGLAGWALISENLFDFNRHAIAASGDSGGYTAARNLILKGGGYHDSYPIYGNVYTHQFDVHGDDNCGLTGVFSDSVWNCGNAGHSFVFEQNAFQFARDNAIKIRGKPRVKAYIAGNVFPHEGLEDDWGDDAVYLSTTDNVELGPGNLIETDTFGDYGVCDFDGDGIDDLFLATGATWWYSSYGEFPWSYVAARTERLKEVELGYFDGDLRCDVLADRSGVWSIASGGYEGWRPLANADAPLAEIRFGRFDPADADPRPEATRRTTHAFLRTDEGQWRIARLPQIADAPVALGWTDVASSGFALDELELGDFTGDGVTDVLGRVTGRWQISKSALEPWTDDFNPHIGDAVSNLKIANMDADDNVDDVLKLNFSADASGSFPFVNLKVEWLRSKNAREPWEIWHTRETLVPIGIRMVDGFAGRFGAEKGGAVLTIGIDRIGRFYGIENGEPAEWSSVFAY